MGLFVESQAEREAVENAKAGDKFVAFSRHSYTVNYFEVERTTKTQIVFKCGTRIMKSTREKVGTANDFYSLRFQPLLPHVQEQMDRMEATRLRERNRNRVRNLSDAIRAKGGLSDEALAEFIALMDKHGL